MNDVDMDRSPDQPAKSSQAEDAATVQGAKAGSPWDSKKFREEFEVAKNKLSDQKFDAGDYPDPLLPRKGIRAPYARSFPAATEERLKELVARVEKPSS